MNDRVVRLEPPVERVDRANVDGVSALASLETAEAERALTLAFDEIEGADVVIAPTGGGPVAALADAAAAPDIFFFEADGEDQAVTIVHALRRAPRGQRLHIVALIPQPTKSGTVRLLREGADDVLSTRPDGIEVTRCLARASADKQDAEAETAGKQARTFVFLHASGGAGATTLAVNTAVQLRQRLKLEDGGVALIDLDLQFGDADLHLDLPMRSRIGELVDAPERLDQRMLEDLMIEGPLGLRVLTAPEAAAPLDVFRPQTVETILHLVRRHYRYVVVDMPLALTHWTETVLRNADQIFLVTQVNVTALRAARRLLDLIRETVPNAPVAVLANRYGGKGSGPKIPLPQAIKALGAPIRLAAPNDYPLLVESLDQGVPASMLRPSAKFVETLSASLDKFVEHQGRAVKKQSLFKFRS
jgi:Flp pilus assembly CpaE family ATPase